VGGIGRILGTFMLTGSALSVCCVRALFLLIRLVKPNIPAESR
jgi:hypothetical protein